MFPDILFDTVMEDKIVAKYWPFFMVHFYCLYVNMPIHSRGARYEIVG